MNRDDLAAELAGLPNWGSRGVECGIRAGLRCNYCGRDLLASLDDYKAWQQDHLVPNAKQGPGNSPVGVPKFRRRWGRSSAPSRADIRAEPTSKTPPATATGGPFVRIAARSLLTTQIGCLVVTGVERQPLTG